ncbi:MAG: hypothetical protein Q8P41_31780 [Pseudomonadota bacterium]|nr:hypothetical protein [Pseudomonadota bacterium]
MIRLLLDPPRFESDEPIGRHALAELVSDACRRDHMKILIRVCKLPNPSREIRNEGIEKTCQKCGGAFRVVDRSDCRALCCRACRKVAPARTPNARKSLLPFEKRPVVAAVCAECKAPLPEVGHAGNLCLECAPMNARVSA